MEAIRSLTTIVVTLLEAIEQIDFQENDEGKKVLDGGRRSIIADHLRILADLLDDADLQFVASTQRD